MALLLIKVWWKKKGKKSRRQADKSEGKPKKNKTSGVKQSVKERDIPLRDKCSSRFVLLFK